MTITDELLYEILKPNNDGKISAEAPITKIIGKQEIAYKLEKFTSYTQKLGYGEHTELDIVKVSPDILIKLPSLNNTLKNIQNINQDLKQFVVIEIENDIHWDFKKSLRKLKRYKVRFPDTRVIIPKDYERFAPFYINEEIKVYLWNAKRRWQCLKCETETVIEGLAIPKCSKPKCKSHKQNEFRLKGLKDTTITEFEQQRNN